MVRNGCVALGDRRIPKQKAALLRRLHQFILVALTCLPSCGIGLCVDQATCPDGSWSSGVSDSGGGSTPAGSTILSSFGDFMASSLHREKTASQFTLTQELALGTTPLPVGYRLVPKIGNDIIPTAGDDDGYLGGSVTFGGRPVTVCGTTQDTVDARVADCAAANSAVATWDGSLNGNSGQGQWKLVTYNGSHEVWRDERTKLIWSDRLGQPGWCRATGSSGGGPYGEVDQYNYCDNIANQPVQATPESWCAEDPGLNTPGAYDSMKGGMRLAATATSPSVVWRLPTKGDYHVAEANGIRFPLPNLLHLYWTATLDSAARNRAWTYSGLSGKFFYIDRTDGGIRARCVGR